MGETDRLDQLGDEGLVALAQAAASGDFRPFEALIARYEARVRANCRFLTGEPTEAEDLAQEVFVKAYFALRTFESRSTFRTWLMRIKAHHCFDYTRSRKQTWQVDVLDPAVQLSPELSVPAAGPAEVERSEERDRIQRVLDGIPATLRVPLVLRDMDDFSYQEIADQLEVGLSAAKMRVKRGREEFRRLYTRTWGMAGAAGETVEVE